MVQKALLWLNLSLTCILNKCETISYITHAMQKRKLRLACVRKRNRQAELEERKNKNRKELCSEREVGGGGREGGKEGRKEGKRVRNRATAHQTTIRKETNRTAITTIAIRRNTPRTMVETSSPVSSAAQQTTKQGGTLKHGKGQAFLFVTRYHFLRQLHE